MGPIGNWNWRKQAASGLAQLRALFGGDDAATLAQHLEDTRPNIPILVFFHLAAMLAVSDFAYASLPALNLGLWMLGGLLIDAALIAAYYALGRVTVSAKWPVLQLGAMLALLLTLHSLWPSMGNGQLLPEGDKHIAEVIGLAVLFISAMVSIRLPAVSLIFVVGLLANSFSHPTSPREALAAAPALFTLVCLVSACAVVLRVSQALRARARLQRSDRRNAEVIRLLLNDLGQGNGDLLWETDANGKLLDSSPRLEEILQRLEASPTCEKFEERFFGAGAAGLLARIAEHDIIRNEDVLVSVGEEKCHFLVSARPILDNNGRFAGYRGAARDVTAQREHELRLAGARDVAQQALDARSQFLAVISHELRTPINAIVGFSEVLSAGQSEHLSVSARREYLGTILESAKHLQGLINEILEATRIERGSVQLDEQPNDVAELIEVVAKIVRDQAAQGKISVVARVVEDVEVVGDLTRLKQVIVNILGNAIKFSPEGSVVNVDMQRGTGGELVIVVRDAGIGISDADAERVFEPFVQAEAGSNRRFGGMGLGLAIARRIARLHGGELTLKGQAGGGTEARFTLPAARVRWPRSKVKPEAAIAAA